MREVFELVRIPGSSYPSFGRGPRAPLAGTGDYLVTMTVGGQIQRQTVHVQRMPGLGDDASLGFGGAEDDDGNP
jgi:hypothetical protein